ncbi:MAG: hypothetical protein LBB81_09685 [Treponema sp.]|jgi:hypothetical protein|nr:hypothetical protein [Treponema sp.]
MKNVKTSAAAGRSLTAIAFAAVIWFSACGGGGAFKLTGIPPESNGKYAVIYGIKLNTGLILVGTEAVNKPARSVTLPRISDGSVTVPMWKLNKINGNMTRYSGSDTVDFVLVGINDSENMDGGDPAVILAGMAGATTFLSTEFSNGSAAKTWSAAMGGGLFGGQSLADMFKIIGF